MLLTLADGTRRAIEIKTIDVEAPSFRGALDSTVTSLSAAAVKKYGPDCRMLPITRCGRTTVEGDAVLAEVQREVDGGLEEVGADSRAVDLALGAALARADARVRDMWRRRLAEVALRRRPAVAE